MRSALPLVTSLQEGFPDFRRAVIALARKVISRDLEEAELADLDEEIAHLFGVASPEQFIAEYYVLSMGAVHSLARGKTLAEQRAASSPATSDGELVRWTRAGNGSYRGRSKRGAVHKITRHLSGKVWTDRGYDRWCYAWEATRPGGSTSPLRTLEDAKRCADEYERSHARVGERERRRELHKNTSGRRPSASSRRTKVPTEIPASATLRQQWVRCGKSTCAACKGGGRGHGPYWYAAWKALGRTRTKCIGRELPDAMLARRRDAEDRRRSRTRVHVRVETPIDESALKPGIQPPPKFRKRPAFS